MKKESRRSQKEVEERKIYCRIEKRTHRESRSEHSGR